VKRLLLKWQNLTQGVKASFAFFLASVVTSGIAYITTPIYTRLLTTEEYGQVSVYLTWMQVFGIVAMFCLSYGVFNNGMLDFKGDRDRFSFSLLILSNIITIVFAAVVLLLYRVIKPVINIDIPLLLLMFVVFLTQPAYNFWLARQRYEYKYKATLVFSVINAIVSPAVAIICILRFKENPIYARLFGAEGALVLIYLVFYIYQWRKSKHQIKIDYWKYAISFNVALIPHYLSTYLIGNSNKILIQYLVSDSAAAYYSVAYSVATVVTIIWSAANASLIPFTYENCEKKNYQAISKVTLPILTFFAFACIFIILLAPELVAIMATKDYREAIYVIPPIVGGVFFQVQYYMYANVLYYLKKPKYVMIGSVTATVLNVGLNYLLISRYGYMVAGYTTAACYLIQAAIDFFAMRKVVGQSIYNMKYVGVLSAGLVFIAIFSNLTYGLSWLRYIVAIGILTIGFIFRNRILSMFTAFKTEKEETNET